jgi:hypothetical protein
MQRERRPARQQPNAAHYAGYAEDDEDIGSIMAKFASLEKATANAAANAAHAGSTPGGGTDAAAGGGGSSPPKLSDEELVRAVGAVAPPCTHGGGRHGEGGVDYSVEMGHKDGGSQHRTGGGHRRPKGELVVTVGAMHVASPRPVAARRLGGAWDLLGCTPRTYEVPAGPWQLPGIINP